MTQPASARSLVYINTLMIQRVLADEWWAERMAALPRLRVSHIKQKFGVLRVYLEGANEAAFDLVREAEALSGAVKSRSIRAGACGWADYTPGADPRCCGWQKG